MKNWWHTTNELPALNNSSSNLDNLLNTNESIEDFVNTVKSHFTSFSNNLIPLISVLNSDFCVHKLISGNNNNVYDCEHIQIISLPINLIYYKLRNIDCTRATGPDGIPN